MTTLSLCMIVKDEESFLEQCLQDIRHIADEIIIVDNGSTDSTKEIALKFTDKVLDFPGQGDFSAIRNLSLKHATSNWILVLDADETISETGRAAVLDLINDREHCFKDVIGFRLDQRTYRPKTDDAKRTTDSRELLDSFEGFESSKVVRLFRNSPKIRFRNRVHELVEESIRENQGEIVDTSIVIHHFAMLKKERVPQKAQEYAELIWKQLEENPDNPRYNRQAAIAFQDAGKHELALKYFIRALKIDPNFPNIFSDIGKAYVNLNRPEKAIKYFNMAIAKNKKDVSSLNNLAVIYMSLKKFDVARKL
ncbi:glycosyltransferase, partial [Candidatus Woesearchaeota archaeon]|nr:glycosyltransferase [Candidatus Woesearchaeota archaeon]